MFCRIRVRIYNVRSSNSFIAIRISDLADHIVTIMKFHIFIVGDRLLCSRKWYSFWENNTSTIRQADRRLVCVKVTAIVVKQIGIDLLIFLIYGVFLILFKSIIQQFGRVRVFVWLALFWAGSFHNDADKFHSIFFTISDQSVLSNVGVTGFTANGILVFVFRIPPSIDHLMMILPCAFLFVLICFGTDISSCTTGFAEGGRFHCLSGDHCHIISGCVVLRIRQAIWIVKVCIL